MSRDTITLIANHRSVAKTIPLTNAGRPDLLSNSSNGIGFAFVALKPHFS